MGNLTIPMTYDLSPQLIAGIATVVAAIIAGCIAFLNLVQSKEQKISEFRQAWIDGLRNDLASYFASARAFTRAVQELHASTEQKFPRTSNPLAFTDDDISKLRYQTAENRYKIALRLNPSELEHRELLQFISDAGAETQKVIEKKGDPNLALDLLEKGAKSAQGILKFEWDRVKRGELAFLDAKRKIKGLIVFLVIIFGILVLLGATGGVNSKKLTTNQPAPTAETPQIKKAP